MAEGIGLLNQRTILLYHGFESLFLRFAVLTVKKVFAQPKASLAQMDRAATF